MKARSTAGVFESLAGVAEVIRVTKPYKLVTLDLRPDKTVVRVGDATVGDSELAIIAGPCGIESREASLRHGKDCFQAKWARVFSADAFGSLERRLTRFRVWAIKAGEIMSAVRAEFGLKIVTEAVEESHVESD